MAGIVNRRIKEAHEFNKEQIELRKNFPDLLQAMKLYREGNKYYLENYLYEYQIVNNGNIYITYRFWDKKINAILYDIKNRYCGKKEIGLTRNKPILGYPEKYENIKVNALSTDIVFDEDEIDMMLLQYVIKIAEGNFKFISLSALQNYVIKYFWTEIKKESDRRNGIKIREENGIKIEEKTKIDMMFFDDVIVGEDEDGEILTIEDVARERPKKRKWYPASKEAEFIFKNYRQVINKFNWLERFDKIVAYIEQYGTTKLFKAHNELIFDKTELARIILNKDRDLSNVTKDIDTFLAGCRNKMNEALIKAGLNELTFPVKREDKKDPVPPVTEYSFYDLPEETQKDIIKRYYQNIMFQKQLPLKLSKQEYKELIKMLTDINILLSEKIKILESYDKKKFKEYSQAQ
jgi:hypothetical protein